MLVFEVILRLKLGILVMQDFHKLVNNVQDLLAVKMFANPDNQALNLIQWLSPIVKINLNVLLKKGENAAKSLNC